jgi:hypothetical protein
VNSEMLKIIKIQAGTFWICRKKKHPIIYCWVSIFDSAVTRISEVLSLLRFFSLTYLCKSSSVLVKKSIMCVIGFASKICTSNVSYATVG